MAWPAYLGLSRGELHHFGEEDCLRGWNGSGTIFFGWCNLRCVFCQNWETSQEGAGDEVEPRQLAGMMLELQARGCHNVNWVTPEHYPEVVRRVVREMHRQVGSLELDGEGLARRGLLVRHLVMPGALDDAAAIYAWLATEISPDTYMNVMDQYRPEGAVLRAPARYPELARPLREGEHEAALEAARRAGLLRIDERRPHRARRRLATWR